MPKIVSWFLVCSLVAWRAVAAQDFPPPAPAFPGGDWENYNGTLDGQR